MRGNKSFKIIDKYIGVFFLFYFGLAEKLTQLFKRKKTKPENILLIKLSALGDTILLIPSISALREKYKDAKIIGICTDVNRAIWGNIPQIDSLINIDIKKLFNPVYLYSLIRNIRKYKFDIAFDFDQWLRVSSLLTLVSGSGKRIGFNTPGQYKHFGFTEKIRHNRNICEADCFMGLLKFAGVDSRNRGPVFSVSSKAAETAKNILKSNNIHDNKYVVVHPGCGSHGWQREWPPQCYAGLCRWIMKEYGYELVLTGGMAEKEVVDSVIKGLDKNIINLQGKLNITELAAVLKNAEFLLSGNTGIMHLAAAVGTRCVAFHGPTNYRKWGPLGLGHLVIDSPLSCSPCLNLGHEYGCGTRKCMEKIEVEDVKKIIMGAINA